MKWTMYAIMDANGRYFNGQHHRYSATTHPKLWSRMRDVKYAHQSESRAGNVFKWLNIALPLTIIEVEVKHGKA
jgi:hypothetical protein